MLNETVVTLQGWVGGDISLRQAGDAPVASFRLGSTPRRFSRRTGEWVDGETQWFTVNAWRGLAENVAASVRRGDPVVVHGRMSASTWVSKEGVEVISLEVDASFIGHDLGRGTSVFTKTPRAAAARVDAPQAAGETPEHPAPGAAGSATTVAA